MQLSEMNGKKVKMLFWDEGVDGPSQRFVHEDEIAYLSSEDYGDHAENWIVLEKNGKEIQRYNTKIILSIEWEG